MRTIQHWYIDEPEVLHIIREEGYDYVPTETPNWYKSDYPIAFNGQTGLLRSQGTQLTALSEEEFQAKEVAKFDAERGFP